MSTGTIGEQRRRTAQQAVSGLILALAGAVGLAALFYITNSGEPLAQQAAFRLGLAGAALASAVAQAMLFAGAWLMGRAAHRHAER